MKRYFISFVILLQAFVLFSQTAMVREYKKSIKTYPFSDPNPIPSQAPLYPYFRMDGFTNTPVNKEWKIVELENDYIKLLIFPEIGGKIWTAFEKKIGKPFIYNNEVVKFRDISMRGPWTSGGIEFNFGIMGHTPNCSTPVDYKTEKKADGSVSCHIGVLDLLTRTYWRSEINLPKDKAYFTTNVVWMNSGTEQPYYHWMNAGLKASDDLEFIFPGNKYIGHEGEIGHWAVNTQKGKRLYLYKENNFGASKSYHISGKNADFSGAYWHNDNLGIVRYAKRDEKPGTKLWIWALSDNGSIWERLLTDTNGQYIELQSGRLFNQNNSNSSYTPFKGFDFAPYATDTWTEYWYPVINTEGLVKADEVGGLNVYGKDGQTIVKFSAAQKITDSLQIILDNKTEYSQAVQLNPMEQFTYSTDKKFNKIKVRLKQHHFMYDSEAEKDTLNRPYHAPENFDWQSSQGQYMLGKDAMDTKKFAVAETFLLNSLKTDSLNAHALTAIAKLYYRNNRFSDALKYVKKTLALFAYDGDANYYYGLINNALGNTLDAKDGFQVAALSPANRTASLTELSRMYLKENDLKTAIEYAEKSLITNSNNVDALKNIVLANRLSGNNAEAEKTLANIEKLDALNHFAAAEKYLSGKADKEILQSLIRNEMPHESYLELALWYNKLNQKLDALKILDVSPASAEVTLWKNYLKGEKPDWEKLDINYFFPFRAETLKMLQDFAKTGNHWKLDYLTSLILIDNNRKEEAKNLLNKAGNLPDFAPFYVVRSPLTPENLENDLKKAINLDNNWRYYISLANYYNNTGNYANAVSLLKNYKSKTANSTFDLVYAKSLLLNKQYKQAEAVLAKTDVLPNEGAQLGRQVYNAGKLFQAIDLLKRNKNKEAASLLEQSKLWPSNLGVGKPYDGSYDTRFDNWMAYLISGKKDKTYLDKIIAFQPIIDNSEVNFVAVNHLITILAYEEKGEKNQAIHWLEKLAKEYPRDAFVKLLKEFYTKEESISGYFEKNPSYSDLNLLLIKETLKITHK